MGLREDALRRILGLDAGRSAQLSLRLAQDQARARSSAILAIEGDRYVLFASTELDGADLQTVSDAWASERPRLLAGSTIIEREWAVLPVGRPVTGIVYLGRAAEPMVPETLEQLRAELGPVLELALSVRHEESEIRLLYEALVQRTPLRQMAREKMLLVLRANEGNKTKAARDLGVTRATLYKWMRKHGLDPELET